MRKSLELSQAINAATAELNTLVDNEVAFEAKSAEIVVLEKSLERAKKAEAASAALARPMGESNTDASIDSAVGLPEERGYTAGEQGVSGRQVSAFNKHLRNARTAQGFQFDSSKHYKSVGDQLQAVYNYYTSRGANADSRLVRAPTGAGEVDPTGGGFLVQTDFADAIFAYMHDLGDVVSRVNRLPISANANGIKIPAIDETSRATGSRWGGLQSYWMGEGSTATPSKPKFRMVEFDVKKLGAFMYTTEELLNDSTALSAIAGQAFSEEITFMTEDAIFEGTGVGQPLGFMISPALVTVAKQNGQSTKTIVKENIDTMWMSMPPRNRKDAVWYINQDTEQQLFGMGQVVGSGGAPAYLPPTGISGAPYATLYGRPVITTEYNSTLGTPGDIVLADLSQYYLVEKGGVQAQTSMHVAFLTDEMVFRITYRVDGKPIWHSTIAPFKGTLVKSPFVALAAR